MPQNCMSFAAGWMAPAQFVSRPLDSPHLGDAKLRYWVGERFAIGGYFDG